MPYKITLDRVLIININTKPRFRGKDAYLS